MATSPTDSEAGSAGASRPSNAEIATAIRAFIEEQFLVPDDDPDFDLDVHLFDAGYVDSMGLVEMVAFLEQRFCIQLPPSALFDETFTTIRGIASAIGATVDATGGEAAMPASDVLERLRQRFDVGAGRAEDMAGIVDVQQAVAGGSRAELERRFRHRYLENPAARQPCAVLVARRGDAIVGFLGMLDCDLRVDGSMAHASWPIDFCVLPEYRGVGVAQLLMQHLLQLGNLVLYGNINDVAIDVAQHMGARELPAAPVLRRWTRPGDLVLPIRELPAEDVYRTVAEPDTRFDALCAGAEDAGPVAVVRTGEMLRWRYAQPSGRRYTIHTLSRGDQLCGYAITTTNQLRGPLRKAVLVDMVADPLPPGATREFLRSILRHVARRGALSMDVLTTCARWREALNELGFRQVASERFLVFGREVPNESAGWHLTFGDADFYL